MTCANVSCAGMEVVADGRQQISSERLMTLAVVAIVTLTSIVLMLSCTSPEFSWDEADYVASTAHPWSVLWGGSDYNRHGHGPMAIYLAKLGRVVFPAGVAPLEYRL